MEKRLKIGVFGGGRGAALIQVLLYHPNAELVAVCDKYEPLLNKVKEKAIEVNANVTLYQHFDEFIRHPGMDAVVLANYATEHAIYAIRCMEAGKHVLSECLPCETMAQAVALIECVEKTGLVYAFAENCCYMPHTFEFWRRYAQGEIGEACYGEGEYIHDCASIQELFPLFYLEKIGCYNWGFVAGKMQTFEPWMGLWEDYRKNPDLPYDFTKWFHDLYRPSLNPYDPKEIIILKKYAEKAEQDFVRGEHHGRR